MTTFRFLVPADLLLNQNGRLHHHAKAKRIAVLRAMGRAAGEVEHDSVIATPCVMDVLVGWPDARRRDRINVSPSVKALIDGLVEVGVLADDSDEHITSETYRSHVAREKGFTRIDLTLTPVQEDAS